MALMKVGRAGSGVGTGVGAEVGLGVGISKARRPSGIGACVGAPPWEWRAELVGRYSSSSGER